MNATATQRVVFESSYGTFQTPYLVLLPLLGIIGLIGVPVGFFWNEGWQMGNQPLEPWSATVIIEIFAGGALLIAGVLTAAFILRRKSPQRVALTDTALIVPKGMFSRSEFTMPRAEIDVKLFNAGFVKQLQIMHKRRKILLSSALFPTNQAFDQLASELV